MPDNSAFINAQCRQSLGVCVTRKQRVDGDAVGSHLVADGSRQPQKARPQPIRNRKTCNGFFRCRRSD